MLLVYQNFKGKGQISFCNDFGSYYCGDEEEIKFLEFDNYIEIKDLNETPCKYYDQNKDCYRNATVSFVENSLIVKFEVDTITITKSVKINVEDVSPISTVIYHDVDVGKAN